MNAGLRQTKLHVNSLASIRRHDMYRKGYRIPVQFVDDSLESVSLSKKSKVSTIFRIFRATAATVLCIGLISSMSLGSTFSFYNDVEASRGNVLTTGSVDFVLEDTPFSDLNGSSSWKIDVVPEDMSNPFYYYASSTEFSGNLELCAALEVTAMLDGEVVYEGPLTALLTGTTTNLSTWMFQFFNFEEFAGETCHFEVDYNGWQTRHDYDQGGYNDTETAQYWITVPSVLISKVYFDYDSGETCTDNSLINQNISSDELQVQVVNNELPDCDEVSQTQEWVELFNLTNNPIDLTGWQFCDGQVCDTIPTTTIPASGFHLFAQNLDIHTQISIPWDIPLIVMPDGSIGDGLRTIGDMLQLRDPEGMTIDQLNWGEVDPLWPNHNATLWPSDSLLAESGAALGRVPHDTDTNQPDDWQTLGLPAVILLSPGTTTAAVNAGEIFQIEWDAQNLNGPDEDLKIDIYYFTDDDGLNIVVLDTENDGMFNWLVPNNVDGNVRIKIVATGPENQLLNTKVVSEQIPVQEDFATAIQALLAPLTLGAGTTTASTTEAVETATSTNGESSAEKRSTRSGGGSGGTTGTQATSSIQQSSTTITSSTTEIATSTASTTADSSILTQPTNTETATLKASSSTKTEKEPLPITGATSTEAVEKIEELDKKKTAAMSTSTHPVGNEEEAEEEILEIDTATASTT